MLGGRVDRQTYSVSFAAALDTMCSPTLPLDPVNDDGV